MHHPHAKGLDSAAEVSETEVRDIDGLPARPARLTSASADDVASLRLVLDAVRLDGARARADVAAMTGLSRPVVAQRVADLLDRGLLEEAGTGPSTGGRPPRSLRLRPDAGIIRRGLGATSIDVAVTTLGAELLAHRSEAADIGTGPHVILGRVEALFAELLAALPGDAGPLSGIGIGVPGPVEFRTGRPVAPPIMPGWDRFPIREGFAARFGAPVWVDNDVNVMSVGEWRAGSARGLRDVVFVKIGTGIGAGLISNGAPHRGAQGAAGDVGHIQVVERTWSAGAATSVVSRPWPAGRRSRARRRRRPRRGGVRGSRTRGHAKGR